MKRKELYRRCLAAVLGTAVAAGAFASPVRAAGLQAAPAAETAPVAEATPLPASAESASSYRIVLPAPGGWSSGNSAVMKVSVTDINHIGWQKIEYRMNESAWIDCESQFADGKAELALHENGTFTLRVTDPQGHAFEESAQVACICLLYTSQQPDAPRHRRQPSEKGVVHQGKYLRHAHPRRGVQPFQGGHDGKGGDGHQRQERRIHLQPV